MDPQFLLLLDESRERLGKELIVTSGYRCPDHNNRVSKTGFDGPHTTGKAADLRTSGMAALDLIAIAIELGFTGFGLKQHGPHEDRFIHLDILPQGVGQPRPWIWTY